MTRPDAILFDMGGVLLEAADRWDAENFPKSFTDGLPLHAPQEWFLGMSSAVLGRYLALDPPRPAVDCRPTIAEWLERRGVKPTGEAVARWHDVLAQWEVRPVFPFVRPTLEALRAMGLRMGVVSNTAMPGERIRRHFRESGIYDFFDGLVFSGDFGVNKPHPSIFQHVLDEMRVEAARAWYVGDKPKRDVSGAHSVGMTAVLVDSAHAGHAHDAPENVPDVRIHTMADLPDLVASYGRGEVAEP